MSEILALFKSSTTVPLRENPGCTSVPVSHSIKMPGVWFCYQFLIEVSYMRSLLQWGAAELVCWQGRATLRTKVLLLCPWECPITGIHMGLIFNNGCH